MDQQTQVQSLGLRKLKDSELTLARASEDIRGRKVVDCDGGELGKIDALFVDESEQRIRFLRISSGGFLGIGTTKLLVPVDAVARVEEGAVCVDQNRERLAHAPAYAPELMNEREYFEKLYEYYGYNPYWTAGYSYPVLPFAPPPAPRIGGYKPS